METLKALLDNGQVVAPGVFDPLSALVASQLSFTALYMSGYSVNASLLGKPDAGFASMSDMTGRVRAITEVTDLPLIADGDTGFGGLPNVEYAVKGYEMAGAAAIQLEDQEYPKRCGHTRNRKVIPVADMVSKVEVAVNARRNSDFLIIARTDARSEHGLHEAIARCEAYRDAGADILFLESPESNEEMQRIGEVFEGTPLVANMVGGGRTPLMSADTLASLGFNLVIHPIYLLGAAVDGMRAAARALQSGDQADVADIGHLNDLLDFEHIWAFDEKYGR